MNLLKIEGVLFYVTLVMYLVTMCSYFVFFALKNDKMSRVAKILFTVSFVAHSLTLIARGVGAGRLPMTNQYEFASSFAWGIALCYLVFLYKFDFNALGSFVSPIIIIIIGYAALQNKEVKSLMPALQSNWLAIHVSTAIIAYGAFGVACAISLMFILKDKYSNSEFWNKHVPSKEKLDMIAYRAVSLGFMFLTFCIITGAIWAEQAWGAYWSWDPKETWALITWIIYSIYLHLRINKGWKGKQAALFAIIGFICVLFTYIGVNMLLPGVHSYA